MSVVAMAITALILLGGTPQSQADGNLWRRLEPSTRKNISLGIVIGASDLGVFVIGADMRLPPEEAGHAIAALGNALKKVAPLQLSDGIDKFYDDYKNRSIEIPGAAYVVVCGINGMPQKELDELTERLRATK